MDDQAIYKHICHLEWLKWQVDTGRIGGKLDGITDSRCTKWIPDVPILEDDDGQRKG